MKISYGAALKREFSNAKYDLYLCGVYLPSTGSNHEIEHACEVLAHDISSLPPDSYVLVAGDVNARCAVLPDFFVSESSFDVPSTRLETKLKLKFVPRWLLNTQITR